MNFVIIKNNEFYTGNGFHEEYPEAKIYESFETANVIANKVGGKVVENYGYESYLNFEYEVKFVNNDGELIEKEKFNIKANDKEEAEENLEKEIETYIYDYIEVDVDVETELLDVN